MLLTITYRGENTQDLGFLLHKNPYRAQQFELSYGNVYVFYPKVTDEETTAAILLDINSIDLAKGKLGSQAGGLFDYINDRPYVTSSFMSTALSKVFGTAMTGRCDKKQELADKLIDLTAKVHMLPCRGDAEIINEIFEPLGYEVEYQTYTLDEKFPEWGDSAYIDLTIRNTVKLSELLNHLYVLIPVFDKQKHYWVNKEEVEKLLRHGDGWLADHPLRNRIINRYFAKSRALAHKAIDKFMEDENLQQGDELDEINGTADEAEARVRRVSLNNQRLDAVYNAVIESGATTVLDLGCGDCKLTGKLLEDKQITKVAAADVSVTSLDKAKKRLRYDRMPPYKKNKLQLFQASATYKDLRFGGYDTICLVEVVEHIDAPRVSAMERVVFEFANPCTVIVTTPNREYNANYEWTNNGLRHNDHRFEWSREQFKGWADHVCRNFGYTVTLSEIGDFDEKFGAPTQMGVFTKCV